MSGKGEKAMMARDISDRFGVKLCTARYWVSLNLSEEELTQRVAKYRESGSIRIDGVLITQVHKETGITLKTLRQHARNGTPLRKIYYQAQNKRKIPNQFKVYDGRKITDIAKELGISMSATSHMAAQGLSIEEMCQRVKDTPQKFRNKDGSIKRDSPSISMSPDELRRYKIILRNNEMLARSL